MKALSRDGFSTIFFQKNWNIVVDNVISLTQNVFKEKENLEDINQTLIVLIPKSKKLEFLN